MPNHRAHLPEVNLKCHTHTDPEELLSDPLRLRTSALSDPKPSELPILSGTSVKPLKPNPIQPSLPEQTPGANNILFSDHNDNSQYNPEELHGREHDTDAPDSASNSDEEHGWDGPNNDDDPTEPEDLDATELDYRNIKGNTTGILSIVINADRYDTS